MTTETRKKIEVIYEKIADKTLSFGCKGITLVGGKNVFYHKSGLWISEYNPTDLYDSKNTTIEITWHPVMIGDVLDYIFHSNGFFTPTQQYFDLIEYVIIYWKEKRKPLEMQSEECIEYIYNLIK